jgi:hypothetical protein
MFNYGAIKAILGTGSNGVSIMRKVISVKKRRMPKSTT